MVEGFLENVDFEILERNDMEINKAMWEFWRIPVTNNGDKKLTVD